MIAHPEERKKMSINAIKAVQFQFNFENEIIKLNKFYDELFVK
jgi:spore maturation protein CgeB